MTFWSYRMRTIKEISETLNEAPKRDDKIKDIDKRWKTMDDSERSNTVIQMVSMRKKLADAYHTERPKPSGGMYQKRAGD